MKRAMLAGFLGLALLALSACSSVEPVPGLTYRLGPGANQITLLVGAGPTASVHAEVAEQDGDSVDVHVLVNEPERGDGVQDEVGHEFTIPVTLEAPLGGRILTNVGQAVPEAPESRN